MSDTIQLKRDLKKSLKAFKFWGKVLKNSNLMDEPSHRLEYKIALCKVKKVLKKLKSGI